MYYFYQNKHKKGPYTLEKLYEFYQQGRIDGHTHISENHPENPPVELCSLFAGMQALGLDTRQCATQKAVLDAIPAKMSFSQALSLAWQGYRKKFFRVLGYALLPMLAWLFSQLLTSLLVIKSSEPLVQIYHAGRKLPQASFAELVGYLLHSPAILQFYLLLIVTMLVFTLFHLLLLGGLFNIKRLIRAEYAHCSLNFIAIKNPVPYLLNSLKLVPLYLGMIMLNMLTTLLVCRVLPRAWHMLQDSLWQHSQLIMFAAVLLVLALVCAPFLVCYMLVCSATSHPSPFWVWKKAHELSFKNYAGWQAVLLCVIAVNLIAVLLGVLAVVLSFSFSLYLVCFYYVYCYRNWLQQQQARQATPNWQAFHKTTTAAQVESDMLANPHCEQHVCTEQAHERAA